MKPVHNDSGKHTCTIVFGKIVRIHVHEGLLSQESRGSSVVDPIVDYRLLRPVARMGGNTYTVVKEGFDLDRPK